MSDQLRKPARHLACGLVVPGCTFTATAGTEEELMRLVAAHAAEVHGITEISPELAAKVKSMMQTQ